MDAKAGAGAEAEAEEEAEAEAEEAAEEKAGTEVGAEVVLHNAEISICSGKYRKTCFAMLMRLVKILRKVRSVGDRKVRKNDRLAGHTNTEKNSVLKDF